MLWLYAKGRSRYAICSLRENEEKIKTKNKRNESGWYQPIYIHLSSAIKKTKTKSEEGGKLFADGIDCSCSKISVAKKRADAGDEDDDCKVFYSIEYCMFKYKSVH